MSDRPVGAPRRALSWLWPVVATVAAAIAIVAAWYLALPRHDVCVMIYPAPPGCGDHRVTGAALWSVVLLVMTAATYVVAFVRRAPTWAAPVFAAVTVVLALASYFSVVNW